MLRGMDRGLLGAGLCLAFMLGACGGGGGSGGSSGPPAAPAPTPGCTQAFNINGVWTVEEDDPITGGYCAGDTGGIYDLTFVQNGSAVVATDDVGRNYNGTYCNGQILTGVPFSYAEDGGMTTITALTITVTSANAATVHSTWTWSDELGHFCSGTTHAVASR